MHTIVSCLDFPNTALPCACCPGTRRSLELCRVSAVRAHDEAWMFTVCPQRRHTANSHRRRQLAVTASARFFSPCAYIYTRRIGLPCARLLAHGKQGLCRPRGCRRRFAVGHRRRFAVGHRRRSLRRVPTGLRRVPRAHGELVVSGSEPSSPEVGLVGLAFSSYASFVAISKI